MVAVRMIESVGQASALFGTQEAEREGEEAAAAVWLCQPAHGMHAATIERHIIRRASMHGGRAGPRVGSVLDFKKHAEFWWGNSVL